MPTVLKVSACVAFLSAVAVVWRGESWHVPRMVAIAPVSLGVALGLSGLLLESD